LPVDGFGKMTVIPKAVMLAELATAGYVSVHDMDWPFWGDNRPAYGLVWDDPNLVDVNGVVLTDTEDVELDRVREILASNLKPGMTYCEVGAWDGENALKLGKAVLPGGRVFASGWEKDRVEVNVKAARDGFGAAMIATVATKDSCGLLPHTCDVVFSRMFFHMLPPAVWKAYLPQMRDALKPGGRMLLLEHSPLDASMQDSSAYLPVDGFGKMTVIPKAVMLAELATAGYVSVHDMDWPFWGDNRPAYGLLWVVSL